MKLAVDGARLGRELAELATFSELAAAEPQVTEGVPDTAVTRVLFSQQDRAARAWLSRLAAEAGLSERHDVVGNTFFRWAGSEPTLPAVATGSHIDAIPNAGMYDGTVGVVGGLEALRALRAAGFVPRRSLELILFTAEEPTRFGIGCLGSRLLSGALAPDAADCLPDLLVPGGTLATARASAGYTGSLASVALAPGSYAAFAELHVEQGPELERAGEPLGIVTDIAAPASGWIEVRGRGGHAGALLMPDRRDALAAAAELVLAVERAVLATGSLDSVATVGLCEVFPGAVNSVPSRVRLSLDVRDIDLLRRDAVLHAIEAACEDVSARRGVSARLTLLNADAPAKSDAGVVQALEQAASDSGLRARTMRSRAYHDTLFMARVCLVAMLFVPSRGGVSHRPDEYTAPADLARGVEVLARALALLSQR